MRPFFLIPVVLALGCASEKPYEPAAETDMTTQGAWVTLFDGSSTDAFRGFRKEAMPEAWQIQEGALAFVPGGGSGGDIITREQFADFELELEWRISEGGNSGIMYRATEEFDAPWMTGPEYQVLDNLKHPDALNGEDRMAGANYDMHPANPQAVRPVGEWNSARIVANGNQVEHWLNGELVVAYELQTPAWEADVAASKWANHPEYGRRAVGHIALQDHGDPVWYRNIRIRRL